MKCAIQDTIAYIKLLAQNLAGCDSNCAILAILFDLAIPVNYDGFEYLKAAVSIQYTEPSLDLVNNIYEILAKRYDVSTDVISSAVRSAIKSAWHHTEPTKWRIYLPTVPMSRSSAPTNAEVISGLARILELWQGCSESYLRQLHKEVVSCGS